MENQFQEDSSETASAVFKPESLAKGNNTKVES